MSYPRGLLKRLCRLARTEAVKHVEVLDERIDMIEIQNVFPGTTDNLVCTLCVNTHHGNTAVVAPRSIDYWMPVKCTREEKLQYMFQHGSKMKIVQGKVYFKVRIIFSFTRAA